jgi:hypothetical protein
MNPRGQWRFSSLRINWHCDSCDDLAVFTYEGRAYIRAVANGIKYFMTRLPVRYWLHDFSQLTMPTIHKADLEYIIKSHIEPCITIEYTRLRADGRDAYVIGYDDRKRKPLAINRVKELLGAISPHVKQFNSKESAMQWLLQSEPTLYVKEQYRETSQSNNDLIKDRTEMLSQLPSKPVYHIGGTMLFASKSLPDIYMGFKTKDLIEVYQLLIDNQIPGRIPKEQILAIRGLQKEYNLQPIFERVHFGKQKNTTTHSQKKD